MDIIKNYWTYLPALIPKSPWQLITPRTVALATGASAGMWYLWRCYKYRKLPPGPPAWPLIGCIRPVTEKNIGIDLAELSKTYGDVYSLWMGTTPVVVLASHSAFKDAFVRKGDVFAYRTDNFSQPLIEYMGFKDDIFASPYDPIDWVHNKAFLINTLHGAGFGRTGSSEKILEQVELLVTHLQSIANDSQPVDLRDALIKTATNCIFSILCSKFWDYDDPKLDWVAQSALDWNLAFGESTTLEHVPIWLAKILYRSKIRYIKEKSANLRAMAEEEVLQHKTSFDPDNPRDFVDIYLTKKGDQHNLDRIIDNLMIFTPDATDTLTSALYAIILYLTYFQNVQQKAVKEIYNLTHRTRVVTWADRRKLPYIEAIMMEVLRIAPVFHYLPGHTVCRNVHLRGYRIPGGTHIYIGFYAALRDSKLFPDPESFKPERFIDDDGEIMKSDITWMSFAMGKRKCPGDVIAKMEMFLITANILQHYHLQFPEGETASLVQEIGSLMSNPQRFRVILSPRDQWTE